MDEQLRFGQELRQKMDGIESGDSEDGRSDSRASTSASGSDDSEEDEGAGERKAKRQAKKTGGRTRTAALDILAGGCCDTVLWLTIIIPCGRYFHSAKLFFSCGS
jgi:hypothetical protein